jgi:hypothetical protein
MTKKSFLLVLLVVAWLGLSACHPVCAMPVGTLLYRTSADGKMYGYNTDELFQPLEISLQKGIGTMKINCGHAGMYVGKINGQDMVLEAISNGVQLTPAKYFVDTGEGEELLGAKIPRALALKNREKITKLADVIGNLRLGYDWGFSRQKGPDDGQWTCVGLTEKIYESLNNFLADNNFDSSSFLKELEYDPSKYGINITPDGFDSTSVFNRTNGDCLSSTKEFSRIARRDWEPSYAVGKINSRGRYFFLPYTQFIQPTLEDVDVDIALESDFAAENIRGQLPAGKMIKVVLDNTVLNNPAETAANLLLALAVPWLPAKNQLEEKLALAIDSFRADDQLPEVTQAAAADQSGKVLGIKDKAPVSNTAAPIAAAKKDAAAKVAASQPAAKKKTTKKTDTAPIPAEKPTDSAVLPLPIAVNAAKSAASTTIKILPEKSIEKPTSTKTIAKIAPVFRDNVGVPPLPADPIRPDNDPTSGPAASTTASTTTSQLNPAPVIKNFSLYDLTSHSAYYTDKQLVGIKTEIDNLASIEKYGLKANSTAEISWFTVLPTEYELSLGDGNKTVRLELDYGAGQATSASASIVLDTAVPKIGWLNLPAVSNDPSFTVAWRGDDSVSGIASYDLDYAISSSSFIGSAPWQVWLADTAATSSVFNQPVAPDNYVLFRARVTDRAGNQSDWGPGQSIKITKIAVSRYPVVISEFAVAGPGGSGDEFVELYNYGKKNLSLVGWKLQTRAASATSSWENRISSDGLAAGAIAGQSFFLLAGKDYSFGVSPDCRHGANWGLAASGGSIRIVDDQGETIDEVAYGKAAEPGSALAEAEFSAGAAAERKAFATSTSALMVYPGDHSLAGNGYDTDSDSDFIVNKKADPQDSASSAEPPSPTKIIPLAVRDLNVDNSYADPHAIKLLWSAPPFARLDSSSRYVIKYVIQGENCNLPGIWDNVSEAPSSGFPVPASASGADQEAIVTGLLSGEPYCFALKTFNGYNFSPLSNVASGNTKPIRPFPADIQAMVDQPAGQDNFRCGNYDDWCGQSFVATENNMTGFAINSWETTAPGGDVYDSLVELCDDTPENRGSFCPNPIKRELLPDSAAYNFTNIAELTVGRSYLIKIHPRGFANGKYFIYSNDNPYPDGQAYTTWADSSSADLWIKIYYDHNFQP